ncbi:RodZ domain-containing protein [Noviherbaspirillum sp. ST9]|uniref:helix-turn-helix domain-containing protein n=1 Tax=Noviherbaspirillum sp. ST9 TaxID=3401606 RepID=UPI003B588382
MSDSGVNDQPVSSEAEDRLPKTSPGARLAALREERGWSVEQVASQLNLAPRQVLAIERDDYAALPGMAIVRGFVRAYAKLLKIDAVPLLADLGGETVLVHNSLTPQKSLSTPFADSRMPSMTERPGVSSKWVVGALLLVLVAVGIWAGRHRGEQLDVSESSSSAVKESPASAASADEMKPSAELKTEVPVTPPAEASAPVTAISEAPPQPGAPAVQTSPAPAAVATQPAMTDAAPAAGKDGLQLKVREESWIEIRRSGDNSVLLSRIVKSGETENVQVAEPVTVVIGNASGVDASLRGAPLELKANAKNNVARLTVK